MLHNTKKQQSGFTIIEVLIVLAIAGLIMLVVFLAVPALQRSSRNTQRKNDVSAIASAVSNYINNNGGTLPTSTGTDSTTNTIDICGADCTKGNIETAKLGYYANTTTAISFQKATVTTGTGSSASTSSIKVPDAETVYIVDGYTCNGTNTDLGSASPRSAAILYATETGSGTAQQCIEQ